MNILTFDTALNRTYLSLSLSGAEVFKIIESDDKNYHSAYLIRAISDMLNDNNIKLADIEYIGVNTGVGSFTGIRVGLAAAKVITSRLNIKAVSFGTFEVFASFFKNNNIVLDAKRGSVFYSNDGKNIALIPYKDAVLKIENSSGSYICDNAVLKNENFSLCKGKLTSFEDGVFDFSKTELELVKNKILNGDITEGRMLKAGYIQTPPISKLNI